MILTFTGKNYSLLQVTNATPEEMDAIKSAMTERVNAFIARRHSNWDGSVSLVWYIAPYFYLPSACWQRIAKLAEPDPQTYRPAYDVQFVNQDKFFDYDITYDDVKAFVDTLKPKFDDIEDQLQILTSMLKYRYSSHAVSTGAGKTYICYLLAQWTAKVLQGKTLIITPRVILVEQGIKDFDDYMTTIEPDERLQTYGICGGFANRCSFKDAQAYIGTYQSVVNMPEDMFDDITTVVCDEGHTVKALSVKECIQKCRNAQLITAISGTLQYVGGADALTIEQFCGPIVSNYSAHSLIEKGRLPKIAVQQVVLQHHDPVQYRMLMEQQRLPVTHSYPAELASSYRAIEMQYLWTNKHLLDYILQLAKQFTDKNRNVLVLFKNRQPTVNLFELANANGQKCHLIFGSTPKPVRNGVIEQIKNEGGWILAATDGVMSTGTSINNLHCIIYSMIGHSPHVVLQSIGRMLRKHPDKFDVTMVYDIVNDISEFGTNFDLNNGNARLSYYNAEQHPVYPKVIRNADNY